MDDSGEAMVFSCLYNACHRYNVIFVLERRG